MSIFRSSPVGVVVRKAGLHRAISLLHNRYPRFGLPLLPPAMTKPIRNILPFSLREEEEKAKPGK